MIVGDSQDSSQIEKTQNKPLLATATSRQFEFGLDPAAARAQTLGKKMKNKGCLIASLLTVAIAASLAFAIKRALTPRNLANEDPRRAFESFVCSPSPQSVRDVRASGVVAFAGGNAAIEFQIDPRDFDNLIRRGKFRLADDKAVEWIKEYRPEGVTGRIVRYVRINEGMTETALFVAEDHRRAWFHEIQY